MKKTLIALAVAAASMATVANAATVYQDDTSSLDVGGRVEVRGNVGDANKTQHDDSKYDDASRVRLNLGGKQKYNDDVTFVGFTEYEVTEDNAANGDDGNWNTRYLYAGAETTWGNVYYGHQDTSWTYLTNWTDATENYAGDINEHLAATADRADNVLRYAYMGERLTFQAHAQFNSTSDGSALTNYGSDSDNHDDNYESSTDAFGLMAAYKLTDSLEIGAGYAQADGGLNGDYAGDRGNPDNGDNYAYTAGIKYTNGGLWLATTYEGGRISKSELDADESDFNAVDATVAYTFGSYTVDLTYNWFDADENNDFFRQYNEENINLGFKRQFTSNVTAFVVYRFNLLDDSDAQDGKAGERQQDDEAMFGLRYAF
ncbi:MAG: porin [Vibrio sp.]